MSNGDTWNYFAQLGSSQSHIAFMLPDGTQILTWGVAKSDEWNSHVWIFADLNGFAGPNTFGKDIFVMYFSPYETTNALGTVDDDGNFTPTGSSFKISTGLKLYGEGSGFTPEEMMEPGFVLSDKLDGSSTVKAGCNTEDYGYTCGAVIQQSGWKFPDGYLE